MTCIINYQSSKKTMSLNGFPSLYIQKQILTLPLCDVFKIPILCIVYTLYHDNKSHHISDINIIIMLLMQADERPGAHLSIYRHVNTESRKPCNFLLPLISCLIISSRASSHVGHGTKDIIIPVFYKHQPSNQQPCI